MLDSRSWLKVFRSITAMLHQCSGRAALDAKSIKELQSGSITLQNVHPSLCTEYYQINYYTQLY